MAITTYAELQAAVTNWLYGRSDLAPRIPEFIQLAEAKFNRELKVRQMEQRASAPVNLASDEPEFLSLPGDFQAMRRVRLLGASGGVKPRLKFATGAQLDDLREKHNDTAGQPIWFAIVGDEMEMLPTPNAAYSVEMVYRKRLAPLTGGNPSNWLLAESPDLYLYGTLLESAAYLHEDERIPLWESARKQIIADMNVLSEEASFNAGPLSLRGRRKY